MFEGTIIAVAESGSVDPLQEFVSTFGPLVAALIALLGVLVTLVVSEARTRRESTNRREDEYREDVRAAIASVLISARNYERQSHAFSDPTMFIGLGFEGAKGLRDATDTAMRELSQSLVVAQLLSIDETLTAQLEGLLEEFDRTASLVHEAMESFWGIAPSADDFWDRRSQCFDAFDNACQRLLDEALTVLAPTVRQRPGRGP